MDNTKPTAPTTVDELARLAAAMRDNYLAKYHPAIWQQQEEAKELKQQQKDAHEIHKNN